MEWNDIVKTSVDKKPNEIYDDNQPSVNVQTKKIDEVVGEVDATPPLHVHEVCFTCLHGNVIDFRKINCIKYNRDVAIANWCSGYEKFMDNEGDKYGME